MAEVELLLRGVLLNIREDGDTEADELQEERPSKARLIQLALVALLVLGASLATYLITHAPPEHTALVITSDPEGIAFERIVGESAQALGRTPILLPNIPLSADLEIRPIYEGGARGQVQQVVPAQLQVVDACREIHFAFE